MDKAFDLEFRGDHIRVLLGPDYEMTHEQQEEFWTAVETACSAHETHRVLVEGFAPKSELRITDVVNSTSQAAAAVPRLWLALCFDFFEPTELGELYKTVAASLGVHVKFFTDRERALNWLRSNSPA